MHTLNYVQITHFEYHKITIPLLFLKMLRSKNYPQSSQFTLKTNSPPKFNPDLTQNKSISNHFTLISIGTQIIPFLNLYLPWTPFNPI